jgi:hypothetical protein
VALVADSYQDKAAEVKRKAFAVKVGKVLANRYGAVIDEAMEGWDTADDPDRFRFEAVLAIKEQLHREIYAMIESAIDWRQAGGDPE